MSPSNKTKVLIGGNVYTLSGEESEEYIQRVALYINNKLDEIKKSDNAKQLNTRLMSVLLEVNIADDYFKSKDTIAHLESIIAIKDKDLDDSHQGRLEDQSKIEVLNKEIEHLKAEIEGYKIELNDYIEMFDGNV